jgi:hypothetical protein
LKGDDNYELYAGGRLLRLVLRMVRQQESDILGKDGAWFSMLFGMSEAFRGEQ